MRDPDGYYIEFCACQELEDYMMEKMQIHSNISKTNNWTMETAEKLMMVSFTKCFITVFRPLNIRVLTIIDPIYLHYIQIGMKMRKASSKAKIEVRKKSKEAEERVS